MDLALLTVRHLCGFREAALRERGGEELPRTVAQRPLDLQVREGAVRREGGACGWTWTSTQRTLRVRQNAPRAQFPLRMLCPVGTKMCYVHSIYHVHF